MYNRNYATSANAWTDRQRSNTGNSNSSCSQSATQASLSSAGGGSRGMMPRGSTDSVGGGNGFIRIAPPTQRSASQQPPPAFPKQQHHHLQQQQPPINSISSSNGCWQPSQQRDIEVSSQMARLEVPVRPTNLLLVPPPSRTKSVSPLRQLEPTPHFHQLPVQAIEYHQPLPPQLNFQNQPQRQPSAAATQQRGPSQSMQPLHSNRNLLSAPQQHVAKLLQGGAHTNSHATQSHLQHRSNINSPQRNPSIIPPTRQSIQPVQHSVADAAVFIDHSVTFKIKRNNCNCSKQQTNRNSAIAISNNNKKSVGPQTKSLRIVSSNAVAHQTQHGHHHTASSSRRAFCLDCAYRIASVPEGLAEAVTKAYEGMTSAKTKNVAEPANVHADLLGFGRKHIGRKVLSEMGRIIYIAEGFAQQGTMRRLASCRRQDGHASRSDSDSEDSTCDGGSDSDEAQPYSSSSEGNSDEASSIDEADNRIADPINAQALAAVGPFFVDIARQLGVWCRCALLLKELESANAICAGTKDQHPKSNAAKQQGRLQTKKAFHRYVSTLSALMDRLAFSLWGMGICNLVEPGTIDNGTAAIITGGMLELDTTSVRAVALPICVTHSALTVRRWLRWLDGPLFLRVAKVSKKPLQFSLVSSSQKLPSMSVAGLQKYEVSMRAMLDGLTSTLLQRVLLLPPKSNSSPPVSSSITVITSVLQLLTDQIARGWSCAVVAHCAADATACTGLAAFFDQVTLIRGDEANSIPLANVNQFTRHKAFADAHRSCPSELGFFTDGNEGRVPSVLTFPDTQGRFGLFSPLGAWMELRKGITARDVSSDHLNNSRTSPQPSSSCPMAIAHALSCLSPSTLKLVKRHSFKKYARLVPDEEADSTSDNEAFFPRQSLEVLFQSVTTDSGVPPIVSLLQQLMAPLAGEDEVPQTHSSLFRHRSRRFKTQQVADNALLDLICVLTVVPMASLHDAIESSHSSPAGPAWQVLASTFIVPYLTSKISRAPHIKSTSRAHKVPAQRTVCFLRALRLYFVAMRAVVLINWATMLIAAHKADDEEELAVESQLDDDDGRQQNGATRALQDCISSLGAHLELSEACTSQLIETIKEHLEADASNYGLRISGGGIGSLSKDSQNFELAATLSDIAMMPAMPRTTKEARSLLSSLDAPKVLDSDETYFELVELEDDDNFHHDSETSRFIDLPLSLMVSLSKAPWLAVSNSSMVSNKFTEILVLILLEPGSFLSYLFALPAAATLYEFFAAEGLVKGCIELLKPPIAPGNTIRAIKFVAASTVVSRLKCLHEQPAMATALLLSNKDYLYTLSSESKSKLQQQSQLSYAITLQFLATIRGNEWRSAIDVYLSPNSMPPTEEEKGASGSTELSLIRHLLHSFQNQKQRSISACYPYPLTLETLVDSLFLLLFDGEGCEGSVDDQRTDSYLLALSILTTCKDYLILEGFTTEEHSHSPIVTVPPSTIRAFTKLVAMCCARHPAAGQELQLWCIQLLVDLFGQVEMAHHNNVNMTGTCSVLQQPTADELSTDIGYLLRHHVIAGLPFDWRTLLLVVLRSLTRNQDTVGAAAEVVWVAIISTTSIDPDRPDGCNNDSSNRNYSAAFELVALNASLVGGSNNSEYAFSDEVKAVLVHLFFGAVSISDILYNAGRDSHNRVTANWSQLVVLTCCTLLEKCLPTDNPNQLSIFLTNDQCARLFNHCSSMRYERYDPASNATTYLLHLASLLSNFVAAGQVTHTQTDQKWFEFPSYSVSTNMSFIDLGDAIVTSAEEVERRTTNNKSDSAAEHPQTSAVWQTSAKSKSSAFRPTQANVEGGADMPSSQLRIGILVARPAFERSHHLDLNHIAGTNGVDDLCPVAASLLSWLHSYASSFLPDLEAASSGPSQSPISNALSFISRLGKIASCLAIAKPSGVAIGHQTVTELSTFSPFKLLGKVLVILCLRAKKAEDGLSPIAAFFQSASSCARSAQVTANRPVSLKRAREERSDEEPEQVNNGSDSCLNASTAAVTVAALMFLLPRNASTASNPNNNISANCEIFSQLQTRYFSKMGDGRKAKEKVGFGNCTAANDIPRSLSSRNRLADLLNELIATLHSHCKLSSPPSSSIQMPQLTFTIKQTKCANNFEANGEIDPSQAKAATKTSTKKRRNRTGPNAEDNEPEMPYTVLEMNKLDGARLDCIQKVLIRFGLVVIENSQEVLENVLPAKDGSIDLTPQLKLLITCLNALNSCGASQIAQDCQYRQTLHSLADFLVWSLKRRPIAHNSVRQPSRQRELDDAYWWAFYYLGRLLASVQAGTVNTSVAHFGIESILEGVLSAPNNKSSQNLTAPQLACLALKESVSGSKQVEEEPSAVPSKIRSFWEHASRFLDSNEEEEQSTALLLQRARLILILSKEYPLLVTSSSQAVDLLDRVAIITSLCLSTLPEEGPSTVDFGIACSITSLRDLMRSLPLHESKYMTPISETEEDLEQRFFSKLYLSRQRSVI